MEKFETWGDFLDWYVSENAKKIIEGSGHEIQYEK